MSEVRSLARAASRVLLALSLTLFCLAPVRAQLQIDITSGVTAPIPIAIEPFSGETAEMSPVIAADLGRSGRFKLQPRNAADYLVTGQVGGTTDGAAAVDFELRNLLTGQVLLKERLTMPAAALRQGAHRVADRIYLRLIGQRSAFATRIAYITVEGAPPQRRHRLVVADADGAGARVVLESRRPLMSPAWSPDGRWLAYVSFETRAAAVWIQDLATAERRMVSARPRADALFRGRQPRHLRARHGERGARAADRRPGHRHRTRLVTRWQRHPVHLRPCRRSAGLSHGGTGRGAGDARDLRCALCGTAAARS
jgi:TolB protein